jgi:hypothetical protein
MIHWLLVILASLAGLVVLPFLFIFLDVVMAWWENLFDRLEAAAERFCQKRGWF